KENDSHEHLFFKCPYSEDIWNNVKSRMGRRNWSNEWEKVASTIAKGGCKSTIKSVLDRMVFATLMCLKVRSSFAVKEIGKEWNTNMNIIQ
ncbi:hypothetical protein Tco_1234301, partial [Tanacetum coccineum]